MDSRLTPSPAQARQTRQQFADPEDYLSFELGKAVQSLPPLYTRLLAVSISTLVFGTITWAYFSKVDEVAVAPGELMPSSQVRPVRSLEGGLIQEISVKEGQRVQKGDVLIMRDSTLPQAEVARLENSIELVREELARLDAERTGRVKSGADLQDQLLSARLKEFDSRQAASVAEINRQVSAINEAQLRLTRLHNNLANAKISLTNAQTNVVNAENILSKTQVSLALAEKKEQSLESLQVSGAVAQLDYLESQDRVARTQAEVMRAQDEVTKAQDKAVEAQDRATSLEKDIAVQLQQIQQARQAYEAAQNSTTRLAAERQSEILTQLNKRREDQTVLEGQLRTAKQQQNMETVTAPVSGTIYSIKATKGPIQPGEELLSILPDGEELLLEVKILNRDIGFIQQGMPVKVKLATFPFQEFGTIDGDVMQVSPNAVVDKDLGLIFPTKIKLHKNSVVVRGQKVKFVPGMSATGEIVTRKKSVLTFLLEPITRRFSEAFSVR